METGATANVPVIVENHVKTGIDEQVTTEKSTSGQSSYSQILDDLGSFISSSNILKILLFFIF